jgi:hypothetical protein
MPKPIRALSLEPYRSLVQTAIDTFWSTRTKQLQAQELRQTLDTGARGAVTGGKHLDGFVALMRQIAMDMGIPADCIHTAQTTLPGFFRASKNWDFLILSPDQKLVAVIEFKSQVGSLPKRFSVMPWIFGPHSANKPFPTKMPLGWVIWLWLNGHLLLRDQLAPTRHTSKFVKSFMTLLISNDIAYSARNWCSSATIRLLLYSGLNRMVALVTWLKA